VAGAGAAVVAGVGGFEEQPATKRQIADKTKLSFFAL